MLFCGIRIEIAGFRTEGETYGLCQQILRIGEGLMQRTIREMSRCISYPFAIPAKGAGHLRWR